MPRAIATTNCEKKKIMNNKQSDQTAATSLYEGKHLRLVAKGNWEYATRPNARSVVAIVAVKPDGHVVLVEQYRPPASSNVIELPAGLVGDIDSDESLLVAAQRELEEETGYAAATWTVLSEGMSSPGLTDEHITLYLATELTKVGPGGGDASESITLHEVKMNELLNWCQQRLADGLQVDLKLFAGLYLAEKAMESL